LYVVNAGPLWDGYRQSIIKTLDLGNNELRKEVEKVGAMAPFNKYDPALNNRELDALDMDQVIHTIQRQAPLLLQLIRDLMAPESRQNIQHQKEPVA